MMENLALIELPEIRAAGVEFSYGLTRVLKGVSLTVRAGEMTVLVGPNGSGKSTLVKCFNKILTPVRGQIYLNGTELNRLTVSQIARIMGYVPQNYNTLFSFSVFETVLMGLTCGTSWRHSNKDLAATASVLNLLGLEDIAHRNINELSGGQQQRVAIARALVRRPQFLVMDEPTSNLDLRVQYDVMNIIKNLARQENMGVLVVVHDVNLACATGDRIVMLKDGVVYEEGKPDDVITPECVKEVYDMDVKVIRHRGRPHILPM